MRDIYFFLIKYYAYALQHLKKKHMFFMPCKNKLACQRKENSFRLTCTLKGMYMYRQSLNNNVHIHADVFPINISFLTTNRQQQRKHTKKQKKQVK